MTSSTKKTTLQFSAGAAAAGLLVLLLVATVAVLLVRRSSRRGKQPYDEDRLTKDGDDSLDVSDFESSTGPRPIPYAQLAAATKDFAAEGKLGQGGSGSVYRGHLKESGLDVAIKVFSRGASMEGRKEFRSEVTVISRLRHRNLGQLIGWCHGRRRLLLVYELVSNGSLDGHLYSTEAGDTDMADEVCACSYLMVGFLPCPCCSTIFLTPYWGLQVLNLADAVCCMGARSDPLVARLFCQHLYFYTD